ncbi:MAG TPA: acetylornithine/succinylornithine family transaminase [Candidatus Kapabacteria bacterium]|mgnify:FL=1|nr:acetylornithine/succinylornithine family transaminase [Candidatus Kapabacteria bacterium]HOM04742.1 acetylornithine/succinylornithine family transaminase [Candidatus Kapabacteria bacterium]HPP39302.1 acetylornithine/succinylornithine family transaminase [Candidatus Kapabacteria bacterium]
MSDLINREHQVLFQTYKRLPIEIDHAIGAKIWDRNGNEYLDFLAGIAVNALGHSHPKIIEAAQKQISQYMHVSNYFYQEPQILLAEKLTQLTGYTRVFFTNSGTEATDGAIKLVRKYSFGRGKKTIVAFSGGFHGRTYGALSIMDKPKYKENMGPFLPDTLVLKFNDIKELERNINDETAAVFLEFIQGEGGIVSPTQQFVDKLEELRNKYNFLLVADEIQCGAGRTGKFFGFEHFGVSPDIVTMAKGIGGGLPLGAILAKDFLADVWDRGNHGTTYGGNAVACATGLVVVEELFNGVMDNALNIGEYLKNKLFQLQEHFPNMIVEVRGHGLMLGLLLSFDAQLLVDELLKNMVISNAASGNVLRIVPPLTITKDEAELFLTKLHLSLVNLENKINLQ